MTIKFLPVFLYSLILGALLSSCTKENGNGSTSGDPCYRLTHLHTHSFTPVTMGDEIKLIVDTLAIADYHWTGPGYFESYTQNPTISSYADYTDRGWYYVSMSLSGCPTKRDSVYVDVKFPQGTPSCTLTNNKAEFGGPVLLGDQSFYYVSYGAGTTGYEVEGNSTFGDLRISMSPYWITHPLEDGIYYTTSDQLLDYADIGKIFISDVNQSIYWVAEADKPVYISHVGGKARISFCGISFSGSWGGTLYHTTVDAQITQP